MSVSITLGAIAGATIFLGLPIALLKKTGPKLRGFLNAVSTGILIFILVEIMGKMLESIEELFGAALGGFPQMNNAVLYSLLLVLGLSAGVLGMSYFETMFIRAGGEDLPEEKRMGRLALMIAAGIGIHNLTEGLAIAQSYSWGETRLAFFLTAGFALHNATEGFGIAAPLSGKRPSLKFLFLLGLLGGGPTFLGAVIGNFWQSDVLRIFSLSLAAGTLIFLIGELMHLGRTLKGELIVEAGLLLGFVAAFVTEILLTVAGF